MTLKETWANRKTFCCQCWSRSRRERAAESFMSSYFNEIFMLMGPVPSKDSWGVREWRAAASMQAPSLAGLLARGGTGPTIKFLNF